MIGEFSVEIVPMPRITKDKAIIEKNDEKSVFMLDVNETKPLTYRFDAVAQ